jgi:hypothetical protein
MTFDEHYEVLRQAIQSRLDNGFTLIYDSFGEPAKKTCCAVSAVVPLSPYGDWDYDAFNSIYTELDGESVSAGFDGAPLNVRSPDLHDPLSWRLGVRLREEFRPVRYSEVAS